MKTIVATWVSRGLGKLGLLRMRKLFKAHLYAELWLSAAVLLVLAIWLLDLLLSANPEQANRTSENWADQPQMVWTAAESKEVMRQIAAPAGRTDVIHIAADMWGPGPPAVDLSTYLQNREFNLIEFNLITAELNRQHRDQLITGKAFAGSFSAEQRPAQYRRLEQLRAGGLLATSIAFQKALVAFRHSGWEQSANDLGAAPCREGAPVGPDGQDDPAASRRLWNIRCNWLQGRLDAQKGDKVGAVAKLHSTLINVNGAVRSQGSATLLPALIPRDYKMDLRKEGVASLWQDYLTALVISNQPLCAGPCSSDFANLNEHGKMLDLLVGDSAARDIWTSYPDVAVLARLLLIREGRINKARKIPVAVRSVNSDASGFYVRRFANQSTEYRLNDGYLTLAQLTEAMIAKQPPKPTEEPEVDGSPAVQFWLSHAAARKAKLNDSSSAELPGADRSPLRAVYESFNSKWQAEWTGGWWPNDWKEWLLSAVFGLALLWFWISGLWAFRRLGRRRIADWDAVMGSAYTAGSSTNS